MRDARIRVVMDMAEGTKVGTFHDLNFALKVAKILERNGVKWVGVYFDHADGSVTEHYITARKEE